MVDLYIDDVSLTEIQTKGNEQILMFRNKEKDKTVAIPVSNTELLNIFQRVKMRCETLNLIPTTNMGKEGADNEQIL